MLKYLLDELHQGRESVVLVWEARSRLQKSQEFQSCHCMQGSLEVLHCGKFGNLLNAWGCSNSSGTWYTFQSKDGRKFFCSVEGRVPQSGSGQICKNSRSSLRGGGIQSGSMRQDCLISFQRNDRIWCLDIVLPGALQHVHQAPNLGPKHLTARYKLHLPNKNRAYYTRLSRDKFQWACVLICDIPMSVSTAEAEGQNLKDWQA